TASSLARTTIRSASKARPRSADTTIATFFVPGQLWVTLGFAKPRAAMRIGRRLIVGREGATADDSAWEYVSAAFEHEAAIEIPCFEYINDHIEVWVKKREVRRVY